MIRLLTTNVISLLVALFSITILVTGEGYKVAPLGLAVLSLLMLKKTFDVPRSKEINKIIIALLSYFAITVLSLLIYGGDGGQADMPSRTILAVTILLLLLKYPPKISWLFQGIIIGSYVSGFISLYFVIGLQQRAFHQFGYMVIQSGNMAMSLGLFSAIITLHYAQLKDKKMAIFSFIGTLLGIMASLLSGARGGWPFSIVIILALLFMHRDLVTKKLQVLMLLLTVLAAGLSYPLIEKRVNSATTEVQAYIIENKTNTAVGARLGMWKSAIYSFIDKPIFGQGFTGIPLSKQQQLAEGKISIDVLEYKRAHNVFLTEAATKGVIGLTALLFFFCLPLNFFRKSYQQAHSIPQQTINLTGLTHVTSVMGYCMTQNYLNHHSGILHYLVYTSIFIALSFHLSNKNKTKTENIK